MLNIKLFPFNLSPKNSIVDTSMDNTFKNGNIFYKQFRNSFKIVSEKIVQKNSLNGLDQAIHIQLRTKELIEFKLNNIILWFLKESLQTFLRNEAHLCKVLYNREDQT